LPASLKGAQAPIGLETASRATPEPSSGGLAVDVLQDGGPPPPPCAFWGTVTSRGRPATPGVPVTAWVGDLQVGTTTVSSKNGTSAYVLHMHESGQDLNGNESIYEGAQIAFRIGSLPVAEVAAWHRGAIVLLDLTVQW